MPKERCSRNIEMHIYIKSLSKCINSKEEAKTMQVMSSTSSKIINYMKTDISYIEMSRPDIALDSIMLNLPTFCTSANFLYRYFHTVFSHVCAIPFALTIWLYDIDVSTAMLS
jgi:hypothetical protein